MGCDQHGLESHAAAHRHHPADHRHNDLCGRAADAPAGFRLIAHRGTPPAPPGKRLARLAHSHRRRVGGLAQHGRAPHRRMACLDLAAVGLTPPAIYLTSRLTPGRTMTRAQFLGTGFAVPERVVTNDDLAALMDTSDEWIRTRTGIRERRWVREGETGADLAHAAAARALDSAGLAPGNIDAIVYATSTPDHFAPGNGVFLQRLLGLDTIPSIDIRNQCSGFVYALSVADAFIRCGQFRHVLVVGAEVQSAGMDVTTRGRNTAVLFADGAGAVVLGPGQGER